MYRLDKEPPSVLFAEAVLMIPSDVVYHSPSHSKNKKKGSHGVGPEPGVHSVEHSTCSGYSCLSGSELEWGEALGKV